MKDAPGCCARLRCRVLSARRLLVPSQQPGSMQVRPARLLMILCGGRLRSVPRVTSPALLPGATPGSIGSAAAITPGEAECEGCSGLPCSATTPAGVSSAVADAFAAAGFEACCAPWPLMSGSAGWLQLMTLRTLTENRAARCRGPRYYGCVARFNRLGRPITPGEAECEGCSGLPCTAATPGAVSSAAARCLRSSRVRGVLRVAVADTIARFNVRFGRLAC